MPLDLPDGVSCFVDANIFYYHFVEASPFSDACTDLLERAASRALVAYTSFHLLAEAMHKVMLAEAAAAFTLSRPSLVNWLQANRQRIGELREFRRVAEELGDLPVTCLPLPPTLLARAAEIAGRYSLLTNDAISLALMRDHGLTHLVTNDDDFDHVDDLHVWKPR